MGVIDNGSAVVQEVTRQPISQTITWTNDDQVPWCHMPLLNHNGLTTLTPEKRVHFDKFFSEEIKNFYIVTHICVGQLDLQRRLDP